MLTFFGNRSFFTNRTSWIFKLGNRVFEDSRTVIALISLRLGWSAVRVVSFYITIRQIHFAVGTVKMLRFFSIHVSIVEEGTKDVYSDLSMNLMAGSSKKIKLYLKPLVNLFVQFMVLIANLLGSQTFLQSFDFGSCAILVSAAYKHYIIPSHSAISSIHICR